MKCTSCILCVAYCLSSEVQINAQNLPKHPTLQQVIGHQQQQQKLWQTQQVPKNSFFFQYYKEQNKTLSYSFDLKKRQPALINFPAISNLSISSFNPPGSGQLLLQSQLWQENKRYGDWKKQGWWKDPGRGQGSLLLREFLNNKGNRQRLRL